jgi:hypothetical protein
MIIPSRENLHEAPRRVKLDEGVSMLGRVVEIAFDALQAGLPVRFRPLLRDSPSSTSARPEARERTTSRRQRPPPSSTKARSVATSSRTARSSGSRRAACSAVLSAFRSWRCAPSLLPARSMFRASAHWAW